MITPIKTRGKINVKYNGQGSGRTIQFNNEPVQTFVNGTGATYRQTELNAPENITQITFQDANSQGASCKVVGLFLDGKVLQRRNVLVSILVERVIILAD